jgi:hypothetical protein
MFKITLGFVASDQFHCYLYSKPSLLGSQENFRIQVLSEYAVRPPDGCERYGIPALKFKAFYRKILLSFCNSSGHTQPTSYLTSV